MRKIRVMAVQFAPGTDKTANFDKVKDTLRAAFDTLPGDALPDFVIIPEMFCCPYDSALFEEYGEREGGELYRALSRLAKDHGIYLVAGSVPEIDDKGHVYNTGYVFDRKGIMIAKHRKVHLFDVDFGPGKRFFESDTLTPGDRYTVFDTEFGKMGLCICYDLRFPELFRLMALEGAKVTFVPASFSTKTGRPHFSLTCRARAVDNQMFIVSCSSAYSEEAGYKAYGHTLAVDPWGEVLGELDEKEGVLMVELDLSRVDEIKGSLPLMKHRREDLYEVRWNRRK